MKSVPSMTEAIVDDGQRQTQLLSEFFQEINSKIDFLEEATGTGNPETVLAANQGKRYRDTNGTASAIMYVKNLDDIAGDRTKGWILI